MGVVVGTEILDLCMTKHAVGSVVYQMKLLNVYNSEYLSLYSTVSLTGEYMN